MLFRLLVFVLVCLVSPILLAESEGTQTWSILGKAFEFEDREIRAQLQHRYSFDRGTLYEEQLNLISKWNYNQYEIGLLLTLGTQDGYNKIREFRYAVQVERKFQIFQKSYYAVRLRQELRDFTQIHKLAHRFRVQNQWTTPSFEGLKHRWLLSSEFNFYWNDFLPGESGFSSHRIIIGHHWGRERDDLGLRYLQDYRVTLGQDEFRHVLQFVYYFSTSVQKTHGSTDL